MPTVRTTSFTVEALEARILLSATPVQAAPFEALDPSEHVEVPVWEVGQMEEQAGVLHEVEAEEDDLYEGASIMAAAEPEITVLATSFYGDGETSEPAIFRDGFTVIETDATHVFRSTTGGIFFSGPGAIDGTAPAGTHEDVHLISATEISIGGPIGGTSPIHNLVVSAGSNVFFGGSINLTGDLIIEQGAQVTFDRDVTVQGNIIIGDSGDPGQIAAVTFNSGSIVNAGGEVRIHTDGTVDFRNRVGNSLEPSGVTVVAGGAIHVEQEFFAATVDFSGSNMTFDRRLRVSGTGAGVVVKLTASDRISFEENLEVGDGDALLTANRVSFTGGEGSIQTVGTPSILTIRPFDSARPIGIGDPSGGDFNRLQVSHIELNAINNGFEELIIGDLDSGRGEVRIGNIGLAQPTAIAQIQNPATFVGGSVIVESRIDVDELAEYIRFVARTGDIEVNGAINEAATERNAWVRLEAEGDIFVNRPIFAYDRISLTAGFGGGDGSVIVESTGDQTGQLSTTSASFAQRRIEISAGVNGGDILITDDPGQATLSASGAGSAIVLQAPGGAITQIGGLLRAEVLAALASQDILIPAADIDRIGAVVIDGETLASGVDAVIDGIAITGAGSLELVALNDLAVDRVDTNGGGISISNLPGSGNDLALGQIDAADGPIDLTADGAILDNVAGAGILNLATTGLATLVARLGIGGSGDLDLDTDLGSLSATNSESGDIFVQDRGELAVVGFLETLAGDGSIALTVDAGDLVIHDAVNAAGLGNILLHAAGGNLVVDAAINTPAGHITLIAADDLRLLENSSAIADDGTVLLRADSGSIEMHGASDVMALDSNIRLEAGADIILGNVRASLVSLVSANGSILNAGGSTMNVTADDVRFEAGNAIGAGDRPLMVTVDRLAAFAGSDDPVAKGIHMNQSGDVSVSEIAPVTVQTFSADGTLNARQDAAALAGLGTGNDGNIVLVAENGAVVLDEAVVADGEGNVRIDAGDPTSDLLVNEDVSSGTGNITIVSAGGLVFAPDAVVSTGAAGDILARADDGALTMDHSSRFVAAGSGVRLTAATSIVVGEVEAEDVSITAESGSVLSAPDSTSNVTATNLRIEADDAVGTAARSILTTVAVLSIHARGNSDTEKGIYIRETDSAILGVVGHSGTEVNADGSTGTVTDADQTGFLAGSDGEIEFIATGGSLTVADGASVASETGAILLSAQGDVNASKILSVSGDIALTSADGGIFDNSAAETPNLSTAGTVHLRAANGIGNVGSGDLNTNAGSLTALNATGGLIVIRDVGALILSDAATVTSGGLRNNAVDGSVLVETQGTLKVDGSVHAAAGGKILLAAIGVESDVEINASVTAGDGPLSILGGRNLVVSASVVTENGGTIDLFAGEGYLEITLSGGVFTPDGAIRLSAAKDVTITAVGAGGGDVHISSLGGSIIRGGEDESHDILGGAIRLSAVGSIGPSGALQVIADTIAAESESGSIDLFTSGDIEVGTVPVVTVDRVVADDTTVEISDGSPVSDLVAQGDGDISLWSESGSITVNDGVSANSIGVHSAGGDIVLRAHENFIQNTGIVTNSSGRVEVVAVTGMITMVDGTETRTDLGNVSYTAGADIFLSRIISQAGDLALSAGDRIVDTTASESPNLTSSGSVSLLAKNGIGDVGSADIDTSAGSVSAAQTVNGRIVIDEADGLAIVGSGIEAVAGGDIILTVNSGHLTVDAAVAARGAGNVLLRTTGAGADIDLDSVITSGSGHITIAATGSITFGAGGSVASGGAGTVTFEAASGSIIFDGAALADAGSGDVRLTAADDIRLGGIRTSGNVILLAATGSILSNGDTHVNVTGSGVRFEAAIGVGVLGAAANPVTTEAAVLTARATSGGINILESTEVEMADVSVLTRKVGADAMLTEETEAALSDLQTTGGNGSIVLRTLAGGITLSDGTAPANEVAVQTNGSGNILIEASGDGAGVTVNVDIRSPAGNISVLAAGSVTFAPGADILTSFGASINVEADSGSILMDDTTRFNTDSGDIRLVAGGDVLIGGISTSGDSAITAVEGSILDAGDTRVDVNAFGLLMNAGDGVGVLGAGAANAIETTIRNLTGRGGAGGVNVLEADNLTIGDVTVVIEKVASDGTTGAVMEGTQSDVRTTEGNGSIVLRLTNGSFILEAGAAPDESVAVNAHGAGNVLIETLGVFTDIFANGGISSGSGNISLSSSLQVYFADGADIRTGGAGTIDVVSRTGFLTMEDNSLFAAEEGDIRLRAPTDILLGGVQTGGNVSVISELASILDNGETYIDIEASGVRLFVHTDIGILDPVGVGSGPDAIDIDADVLTAYSVAGDINLIEQTEVTVDDVAVNVNRVGTDGTTTSVMDDTQADIRTDGGSKSIILRALAGDIVLNDGSVLPGGVLGTDERGVFVPGSGNILIEAVAPGTSVVANAGVSSGSGHITVAAGQDVEFTGGAGVATGSSGTIHVTATTGNVSQAGASRFTALDGDIRVVAGDSIHLGEIETGTSVSLIAEAGSVLDSGNVGGGEDVIADQLRVIAGIGIGEAGRNIDTLISALAARAGSGGIFIIETDALVIDDTDAVVQQVNPDNTLAPIADAMLSDLATIDGDGSIILRAIDGPITLNDGTGSSDNTAISAHGSGNVLVESREWTPSTRVTVNADIVSSAGHITVVAAGQIRFSAGVEVNSGAAGTISVVSSAGNIGMEDGSLIDAGAGNIRLNADNYLILSGVHTTGDVSLSATHGRIGDNGDIYIDVVANSLRMAGTRGVGTTGSSANAIETTVSTLTAHSSNGAVNILETDALIVDAVEVTVQQVDADSTTSPVTDAAQADVVAKTNVVIRTLEGTIALNDGSANGLVVKTSDSAGDVLNSGNILIEANGADADVIVNADVITLRSHISILASRSVQFGGSAAAISGEDGTVNVEAGSGSIEMADGSRIEAGAGNIRLQAADNVVLGGLLTTGDVTITAHDGSIFDGGDAHTDIVAVNLRMIAGIGIGSLGAGADAIETAVSTLSARATSGGVNILESDNLTVDAMAPISVMEVTPNATVVEVTENALSDVRTTDGNGSVVVRTLGGSITLNDGTDPADDTSVLAHGSGNILLQAMGAGSDIDVRANVRSGSGHVSIEAGGSVAFASDVLIRTGESGSINIEAESGSILMADSAVVVGGSGDIRLFAGIDVLISGLTTLGDTSITARDGSILDNGDTRVDVRANGLRMAAGVGIGVLGDGADAIEVSVASLTAHAGSGGINILEADGVIAHDVEVVVQEVNPDASTSTLTDATQAGLITTAGDGSIVLRATEGRITIRQGRAAIDGMGIGAHGSGNILVEAIEAGEEIFVHTDVVSGSGNISLVAAHSVVTGSNGRVETGGSGTISFTGTTGDVTGVRATAVDGDVRVLAAGVIFLHDIETGGNVSLISETGSIRNGGLSGGAINVTAKQLRIFAAIGIGEPDAAITTNIVTVSAAATSGGIFIQETNLLVIDDASASVQLVLSDASVTTVTDAAQSDVVTASGDGSIVVRTLDGGIMLQDGTASADNTAISAHGAGNVLLDAGGTASDIWAGADVRSGTGHLTVIAGRSLELAANVEFATTGAGTINLEADAGSIVIHDTAFVSAVNGNIRMRAGEDVLLGSVSTGGHVSITAGRSILDNGETHVDVVADGLRMDAGGRIGTLGEGTNPIETTVSTLTARAGGEINVFESTGVVIDDVTVSVLAVSSDATTAGLVDDAQSDLRASGSIVLRTADGDITINKGASSGSAFGIYSVSGRVLLEAMGEDRSILANASINAGGSIRIVAALSIQITSGGRISTGEFRVGTIDLWARAGSIAMEGALIRSAGGDIRLTASQDVLLGEIESTHLGEGASVSIQAIQGSVLNSSAAGPNVIADALRILAGTGIGTLGSGATPVETTVDTLAARATSGGINILESTGLMVDWVAIRIQQVGPNGEVRTMTEAGPPNVATTSGNGSIAMRTLDGNLTLNGLSVRGGSVLAHGTDGLAGGNILLEAGGAGSNVRVNADVRADTGHVTLLAAGSVELAQGAGVISGLTATVNVEANAGSILMSDGSRIDAADGDIRLLAGQDVLLGGLVTTADAAITATSGSILDNGDLHVDVVAAGLRMIAGIGIGTLGEDARAIDTAVEGLSARATSGGINVLESDGLVLDGGRVTVEKVGETAETTTIETDRLSNVVTTGGDGSIVLRATHGDLVLLPDDLAPEESATVSADGTGNLLLETLDVNGSIVANGDTRSGAGHVTIIAGATVSFGAGIDVISSASGTIDVEAGAGSIEMSDSSLVETGSGAIRLFAAQDVLLGGLLTTGNASVTATAGSILSSGGAYTDVVGAGLRMVAGVGIGTLGDDASWIEVTVTTLTARAAAGGIHLAGTSGFIVDDVEVTVQKVAPDGSSGAVTDVLQSDVRTTGGGGAIVLVSFDGDVVLNDGSTAGNGAVSADGSGNILISSLSDGRDITVNADLYSGTGHITVTGTQGLGTLAIHADLLTGGSGTILVESAFVTQAAASRISAEDGDIRVSADSTIRIGQLATGGNVSIYSSVGSVLAWPSGTEGENVIADELQVEVGGGVGADTRPITTLVSSLAIVAESEAIFILETDALVVESASASVSRLLPDGSVELDDYGTVWGVTTLSGDASIVIRVLNGSITLFPMNLATPVVSAHGAGNVLVETMGAGGEILVNGVIRSGEGSDVIDGGHITLVNTSSIRFTGGAGLYTIGTGTINVEAEGDLVLMDDETLFRSGSGDIRVHGAGDVWIGGIETKGNVSITSVFESISDNGDTYTDVVASGLQMVAGNGIGALSDTANPLETTVAVLAAQASGGGINVLNSRSLVVDDVSVTVQEVSADAALTEWTSAALGDVTTSINGSIVLRVTGGDLILNGDSASSDGMAVSANGSGNILLEAIGSGSDVAVNGTVQSGSGSISVTAAGGVTFNSGAGVATGGSGTVSVEANGGDVSMHHESRLVAEDGVVVLYAREAVHLGGVTTGANAVVYAEMGRILASPGASGLEHVIAANLLLYGNGVGTPADPITINVDVVSVWSSVGVALLETDGLVVGGVQVSTWAVNADGTAGVRGSVSYDGISALHSPIIVRATDGDIVLNSGVRTSGAGDILIEAMGPDSNFVANARVNSGWGHITILAERHVHFTSGVSVRTRNDDALGTIAGTINIEAATGSIEMHDEARIRTGSGDIRLRAEGDVLVGGIETSGNASIAATIGSVRDHGDTYTDIVAAGLRLAAGDGVGTLGAGANPIETAVTTLSARAASGGVNVFESDGVMIDDVAVVVSRVNSDASLSEVIDATQSDVRTTSGNGSIVIRAAAGSIVLNDGTAPEDSIAISAHGIGNVLVETLGVAGDIVVNANIVSGEGSIGLRSTGSLIFGENVTLTSAGDGSFNFETPGGSLVFHDTVLLDAGDGDIRLFARDDVIIGGLLTTGNVSITAVTGSILESGDTYVDVIASGLRMVAGNGIGILGDGARPIETDVATLSARAAGGGINLLNSGNLLIDDVEATVSRVEADGTVGSVTDEAQSDVVTTAGGGTIVIRTVDGSLTLNDGAAPTDDVAVSANGSGNILLEAGGAASDLLVNAAVGSDEGHITLLAGRSHIFAASVEVTTGGQGTVDVEAGAGSVSMSANARIRTDSGNIRLLAGDDVLLGEAHTGGTVSITAGAGSILNYHDGQTSIFAAGLRLNAGDGIGTLGGEADPLRTDVDVLTAHAAGGGINILNKSGLVTDEVGVTVSRVKADGTSAGATDAAQQGVRTLGGNGSVVLRILSGDLVLNSSDGEPAVAADGLGNILLHAAGAESDFMVNAGIVSGSGHITVSAARTLELSAAGGIATGGIGALDVRAGSGSIVMHDEASIASTSGDVIIVANDDIWLGGVLSEAGVLVSSISGSVRSSGDTHMDITSESLVLLAGTAIGILGDEASPIGTDVQVLSAHAGAGGINISNTGDLTVAEVALPIITVEADGGFRTSHPVTYLNVGTSGGGSVVLRTISGSITLSGPVAGGGDEISVAVHSSGSGNILIEAGGEEFDVVAHAGVVSVEGHITLVAGRTVALGSDVNIITLGLGEIFLHARAGAIEMDDVALIEAGSGNVGLFAETTVLLGGVRTSGDVFIFATRGSILGAGDTYTDVIAASLGMVAGVGVGILGEGAAPINVSVDVLNVRAGAGGINVLEADGFITGDVSVDVIVVQPDAELVFYRRAMHPSPVSTTSGDGSIVLRTVEGSIVLDGGRGGFNILALPLTRWVSISAHGTGNILVEAAGEGGNITGIADIRSGGGHITLLASGEIQFAGEGGVRTQGSGNIDVEASEGEVLFGGGVDISAGDGDIQIRAGGSAALERVVTAGNVGIFADAVFGNPDAAGEHITAGQLQMSGDNGIGMSTEHLKTEVGTISARSLNGGIFILETDDLVVGNVGTTVERVGFDGTSTELGSGSQWDIRTTGGDGSIVVRTVDGSITLHQDPAVFDASAVVAHGWGNILLQANGSASSLDASAGIRSGNGSITLFAGLNLEFVSGVNVRNATVGAISVEAEGGSIVMGDAAIFSTGSGSIRLAAGTDVRLGGLLTTGNASVIAETGSIFQNGDTHVDVVADGLRMVAGVGIGTLGGDGERLATEVFTLSARAGSGGINIVNTGTLAVGGVAVTVQVVSADAATGDLTDLLQAGVRTSSGNGAIVLRVNGALILNDGDGSGEAISAHGSGNILLEAMSGSSSISLNADVRVGHGHVRLLAADSISFGDEADLFSGGFGSVSIEAAAGSIAMADNSRISAGGGDVQLVAADNVIVGGLGTTGNVSLVATAGSIEDSGDTYADVAAGGLRMVAGIGIGSAGDPIEVTVSRLTTRATSGGIYVMGTSGFTVDDVAVTVQRVNPSSSINPITDGTQEGVRTTGGNGAIALGTIAGHIVINSGVANPDGSGIVADGSGTVSLTTEIAGGVLLNAAVRSGSGDIDLDSAAWVRHGYLAGEAVIETAGAIRLSANTGLGQTGAGALLTRSARLEIANEQDGSVYVRLDETTVLGTVALAGPGSFHLDQTGGNLEIHDSITVGSGAVTLVSRGAVSLVNGAVTVAGDIDILAESFSATASAIESVGGSIRIRAAASVELDAASPLAATTGDIRVRAGAGIVIGGVLSSGLLELVTDGSIQSSLPGDPAGVLEAGHLRMRAGGSIGSPAAPVYFDAGRVDLDAGGTLSIHSLGDIVLGRFGLTIESAPGEEVIIKIEDGEIKAVGGQLVDRGSGTLVLGSDNEIELNLVVISEGGSIRVEAGSIASSSTPDDGRLQALNGSVTFIADEGIGGATSGALNFHSPEVQATTGTGPLNLNSVGATSVVGAGLIAAGGSGPLLLNVESGNLTLVSDVRHLGTGSVSLGVLGGGIEMNFDARVSTTSGAMNLTARDNVMLSRIQTTSGQIRTTSLLDSIFGATGLEGSSGANIVVTDLAPGPILEVARRAFLSVLADKVTVNGFDFHRSGRSTIPLNLTFS